MNVDGRKRRKEQRYVYRTCDKKLFRLLRLRNDLYCVEWGVKLYSLTHPVVELMMASTVK